MLPPLPWEAPPARPAGQADASGGGGRRGKRAASKRVGGGRLELIIGAVALLLVFAFGRGEERAPDPAAPAPAAAGWGTVAPVNGNLVVDVTPQGHLVLQNGLRVELLGVRIPTVDPTTAAAQHFARRIEHAEAERAVTVFGWLSEQVVRRLVLDRAVEIEFDPGAPLAAQEGRGVALAYVWLEGPRGQRVMLNYELVKEGYAEPLLHTPYAHRARFAEAGVRARQDKAGIWRYGVL